MLKRQVSALVPILLFLLLWDVLARRLGPGLLPRPQAVFGDFCRRLGDPVFLGHCGWSFFRSGAGILLGTAAAYPLGVLLGAVPWLGRSLSPLISLSYPVPKILFLPALLVILGLGEAPKVMLVALTVGYLALVTVKDRAASLDRGYLESFHSVYPGGGGPGKTLRKAFLLARHVHVPYTLPAVWSSLRLSSGTAVAVLFMAESFATQEGLGFVIMDAWGLMDLPRMFSGIAFMGLLGGLYFALAGILERLFCRWTRI
ncbi:MAG: ABC transporter permease [Deltaproteobacteria bacterium]|nr:ABC transporter permease [Deltaproteobacteria bacterium]